MKQEFIKVKIDTDKGITEGFININRITAFRESTYDCNRTIVFAGNNSFVVYMSFKELCKIMGLNHQ